VNERFEAQGLLPSNPLTKALAYARDRRQALEVFLSDPDVPIDTNHL
jgi:transposase